MQAPPVIETEGRVVKGAKTDTTVLMFGAILNCSHEAMRCDARRSDIAVTKPGSGAPTHHTHLNSIYIQSTHNVGTLLSVRFGAHAVLTLNMKTHSVRVQECGVVLVS